MSALTSQPTGQPCHHCGNPAVMVASEGMPDGTFVEKHHTCEDCITKSLPKPPTPRETAFLIQKRFFTAVGFQHHSTDVGGNAIYIGHGLNVSVQDQETDPAQLMIHILSTTRQGIKAEARRNLERIVGPLAKI